MDTGVNSGPYKVLFVLHMATVIVGFGTVALLGVFGAQAKKRRGAEGLAIFDATWHVGHDWAQKFIYAVPLFGILMVFASGDVWDFGQTWVWLSLVLYVVALGISHGMHQPNLKRMGALMAELVAMGPPPAGAPAGGPPPQVLELEARGKRAGMLGGVLNLFVLVLVALMIWKPGA